MAGRLALPDAVAALMLCADGRYVMQLRDERPDIVYPGHWGCFGGAVNRGEAPGDALRGGPRPGASGGRHRLDRSLVTAEVGLATLSPGGGHGIAGSANFSDVELYAKAVPR